MTTPNPSNFPIMVVSVVLIAAFFGLLLIAAVKDIRTMTIPNGISIALAALYPLYVFTTGSGWANGLIAGGIVFAVGTVFFALNWLGGGDVKLLSATSLWAGTDLLMPALFITALAGGVLCVVMWVRQGGLLKVYQRLSGKIDTDSIPEDGTTAVVPYGVAILAGGGFVAVAQLLPIYRIVETVL